MSNKADSTPKLVRRDKKDHYILTQGIIKQEVTRIVNNMHQTSVYPITYKKHYWT
jgi:hypothetical protein